ncbi:hypothetical protein LEP1GSC172_2129 [Leptospira noguchii]|uniref:Uncharacterized protein n=2 Tax=Leptospira noguchii TaxID=28182 RepID=T0GVJ9_9LEPT|nr:hypothetical protein LEP1GSC172_2129 [Leptospira noguchii]EQA72952.1 hypothetical protein LEP1GSC059_1565 [Leptospira noguchii serovar Panama str. CZ214]
MNVYCFVKVDTILYLILRMNDVVLSLILVNVGTITILNFTIFSFGSKKEC